MIKTSSTGFTKAEMHGQYGAEIFAMKDGDYFCVGRFADDKHGHVLSESELREAAEFFVMLADELKRDAEDIGEDT